MTKDLVRKRSINKVAILGSGASAEAGAPIIDNFWDKIEECIKDSKFTESEIKRIKSIQQKRKQLLPNSNIEQFYSYVDFQIDFDILVPTSNSVRSITYRVVNKKHENCTPVTQDINIVGREIEMFKQLRDDLSWLIIKTLDKTLENINQEIVECYKKIIKNFDATLSFNWDHLYEYAYKILNGEVMQPNQLGFSETMLCKPALLKLHGSSSWGKCTKCNSLFTFPDNIEHLIRESASCPKCIENSLMPTSVLPTLNKLKIISEDKDNRNALPPFRRIWHSAMHGLTDATEIYCFGYSLSDMDVHTQIFFKSAIQNNINDNIDLYVINKNCSKDLKERYKETFGNKAKINFIEKTFKEFLTNF